MAKRGITRTTSTIARGLDVLVSKIMAKLQWGPSALTEAPNTGEVRYVKIENFRSL